MTTFNPRTKLTLSFTNTEGEECTMEIIGGQERASKAAEECISDHNTQIFIHSWNEKTQERGYVNRDEGFSPVGKAWEL